MIKFIFLRLLFIIFFIFLIFPQISYGDGVLPGRKELFYCFIVSNVNSYPNYQFYSNAPLGYPLEDPFYHTEIIEENKCISFLKSSTIKISAKKIYGQGIPIVSNLAIQAPGIVDESNPLNGITDVLTIKSIDNNNLIIEKTKVIYTYNDGTTEEKYYQNQNERPEPSKKLSIILLYKYYWGIPFIITFFVEFLIIWLFIKGKVIKPLSTSFLINFITVPIANFIYTVPAFLNYIYYSGIEDYTLILIVEIFIFIIESLFLKWLLKIKYPKALLISFVANLVTFLIGLFLMPIIFNVYIFY